MLVRKITVLILSMVFLISMDARIVQAREYFHFERPRMGLLFSYEFEEEERTGPNIDSDDESHEFRERLELETEGWVYHPGLLKYTAGVQPELEQRIEERSLVGRASRSDFLLGYDLHSTFLQYKPYTLSLFAQRYETPVGSAFAEKSETETDVYGGNLTLKYRWLPTTLGYTHLDRSQTGFFRSEEETDNFRLSMRHHEKNIHTHLNATYSDNTRTTNGVTTRVKNSNSYIQNNCDFTGDRRKVLNSFLSYRWAESDSVATSGLRLSESFHWRHRENLRSDYEFTYSDDKFENFDRKTTYFAAGFTHLLYENLTTTLSGDASLSDFTGGSEDIHGGRLDLDYRRSIPWGMLHISIGHDYEIRNRDFIEQFIQVIDESHILRTGVVTLLGNENVDISSITVTDTTGTIIYVKDIDYTVTEIGTFVRISRTTFGSIADGQEVLVDYRYLSNPAFDDATFGQSYGIGLDLWSALELYYRYDHLKQSIRSGIPPETLVDDTTHTAEMRLDWGWTSTRLSYEDADRSSGISTERWRAEEVLTFRPRERVFSSISGRLGRTRFKDTYETEEFYGLRAHIDWVPARWGKLRLEGFWDRVSGDIEKTVDTGILSTLELYYGIWSGKITYTFLNQKDERFDDRRTNHYLLFQIRRELW